MNPVLMRAKALAFGTEEHTEARDLDFVLRCGELTALVGEQDSGRQILFDGLNGNCAVQRGMILTPEGKIFPLQKKVFAAGSFFTEETSSRVQGVELTEMLFLMQPGGCKRLHWNTARRRKWAQELLDQVQLERDVREDVSRLSPMECFQLNLAAALDSGASLMTIQEDFEGFSVADFDQLVPILKKLQQTTGLAILLNTNSLRALEKLADEVFVFRNGTIAKKLRGEKIAPRTILDHLGGAQAASEAPRPQRETLFAIQGLRVRGCSCPIVLHRGEVLHVVDYDVREKQELYRILSGQQLAPGVSLQYEGHLLPQNWSCNPERYPITALDRFGAQGLFPQMSVAQNLIFPALRRLCGPFGLLDKGLERAALQEWDGKDQLNGKNMAQLTQAQAIALQMESWTLARRKVLILLEPFLHTDNASRSVLQRAFARFREQGGAILVISSSRTSYLGISEQDAAAEQWAPWYDRILDVQEVCRDET